MTFDRLTTLRRLAEQHQTRRAMLAKLSGLTMEQQPNATRIRATFESIRTADRWIVVLRSALYS